MEAKNLISYTIAKIDKTTFSMLKLFRLGLILLFPLLSNSFAEDNLTGGFKSEMYLEKILPKNEKRFLIKIDPYFKFQKSANKIYCRWRLKFSFEEDFSFRQPYLRRLWFQNGPLKWGYFRPDFPLLKSHFIVDSYTENFLEKAGDILHPAFQLTFKKSHYKGYFFILSSKKKKTFGSSFHIKKRQYKFAFGLISPLRDRGLGQKPLTSILFSYSQKFFVQKVHFLRETKKHTSAGIWWALSTESRLSLSQNFELLFSYEEENSPYLKKNFLKKRKKTRSSFGFRLQKGTWAWVIGIKHKKKTNSKTRTIFGIYLQKVK